MLATNMSEASNSEEKLRWAFKMYDKDGSGSVEIEEMIEIVGNLFELEGISKVNSCNVASKLFVKSFDTSSNCGRQIINSLE